MPVRHDISAQLGLYVLEVGPFMRQDQQHVGPFAQRQLHNCALPYLRGNKRKILQMTTFHTLQLQICYACNRNTQMIQQINIRKQIAWTMIYLIIQVVVLTRVGHQWSHHCGCFIHMKLLQGGLLWLEGCPPVA